MKNCLMHTILFICPFFLITGCNSGSENSIKKNGEVYKYYSSGQVKEKVNYKNGYKNGLKTVYYKDGTIEAEIYYRNDTINGTAITYFSNGDLRQYAEFRNGKSLYGVTLDEDSTIIDEYRYIEIIPEFEDTILVNTRYKANVEVYGPLLDSNYTVGYAITTYDSIAGKKVVIHTGTVQDFVDGSGYIPLTASKERAGKNFRLSVHIFNLNDDRDIAEFMSQVVRFNVKKDSKQN